MPRKMCQLEAVEESSIWICVINEHTMPVAMQGGSSFPALSHNPLAIGAFEQPHPYAY